jgi:hypothetical protein
MTAKLVVGDWGAGPGGGQGGHAWVIFESGSGAQLLEPVRKDPATMIRPLAQVKGEYVPHFSVGPDGRMVAHAGYLLHMRQQEERRRARRRGKQAA